MSKAYCTPAADILELSKHTSISLFVGNKEGYEPGGLKIYLSKKKLYFSSFNGLRRKKNYVGKKTLELLCRGQQLPQFLTVTDVKHVGKQTR